MLMFYITRKWYSQLANAFNFASRSPIFIIVLFSRQFWLLWNPQSLSSEGNAVCCDSDEWCVLGDNFCASDHFKSVNVK